MRVHQMVAIGAFAVVALSACTTTPEAIPDSVASPGPSVETVTDELGHIEVVRTSTYPEFSPVPQVVLVRSIEVDTRLSCKPQEGRLEGAVLWKQGPRTVKTAAEWLIARGSTAIVVTQSPSRAVVLELNGKESVVGRTSLQNEGGRWYATGGVQCTTR